MNKIYLDKLCEFSNTTYNNYQNNKEKDWNIDNQIDIIKQNLSLNEKGILNKFNYIDLNWLIPNIEQNELVLIYPLCFNVKEKYEWNYLLNAMLIILNDDYLYKTNVLKKNIIETFDKTYRKKINLDEKLSDEKIEKIAIITNISLIILSDNCNIIYNKKDISNQKYIVLYKNNDEYYPVMNWTTKYYTSTDYFIHYLIGFIENSKKIIKEDLDLKDIEKTKSSKSKLNKSTKSNKISKIDEKEEVIEIENIPKIKKVKSNVSILENSDQIKIKESKATKTESKDNSNQFYEEVVSVNENYALYLSEAVENNKDKDIASSTSKNPDQVKKKIKKNSKDIFVSNKDTIKDQQNNLDEQNKVKKLIKDEAPEDSVFNPTEKITMGDVDIIKKKLKPSITLEELQTIAIKLSINIVQGSNKNGKPKRKTKSELIDEINEYTNNFIN